MFRDVSRRSEGEQRFTCAPHGKEIAAVKTNADFALAGEMKMRYGHIRTYRVLLARWAPFFRGERVSEAKTRNRSLVETYFKKWAWRLGMHVGAALSRVTENVT